MEQADELEDLIDQVITEEGSAAGEDLIDEFFKAETDSYICDPDGGGCGHFLTAHTRGMILHDRCLMVGCPCKRAVVTRHQRFKVEQEER